MIVSGGVFCPLPAELKRPEWVIACDRGWQYAQRMGLTPDLIVGDFDSSSLPDTETQVRRYPREKDDTDTMLAAREALEKGFREVVIACALGGRLDHTLANFQTAAFLVRGGARTWLLGTDTEAVAFSHGRVRLPGREGWSLSVFSLTDCCTGVTIRGTKYRAEHLRLSNCFPIGVSNAWEEDAAEISVESGILLVVQSRLGPEERFSQEAHFHSGCSSSDSCK